MEFTVPVLPEPRLFTLTVIGEDSRVLEVKNQLILDDHDLDMSIQDCEEEFPELREVTVSEVKLSFTPRCHDVFVSGLKHL